MHQEHQTGTHRAKAAIALALVELTLRQLHVARGEVVDDGDSREPVPSSSGFSVVPAGRGGAARGRVRPRSPEADMAGRTTAASAAVMHDGALVKIVLNGKSLI